jgi:hypothetical protein
MATKKTTAPKTTATKTPAKKTAASKAPAKATPKLKVNARKVSPKDMATKAGEPYVAVIGVELDPDNVGNGAFELDWNDIFVAKLVKAGYQGQDDAQIVDRWFQDICRNVLMENFEQWNANQGLETRIVTRKDLGDGRSELS